MLETTWLSCPTQTLRAWCIYLHPLNYTYILLSIYPNDFLIFCLPSNYTERFQSCLLDNLLGLKRTIFLVFDSDARLTSRMPFQDRNILCGQKPCMILWNDRPKECAGIAFFRYRPSIETSFKHYELPSEQKKQIQGFCNLEQS